MPRYSGIVQSVEQRTVNGDRAPSLTDDNCEKMR